MCVGAREARMYGMCLYYSFQVYIYIYIYIYIVKESVVTNSLCGFVANQVRSNFNKTS